VPALRRRLLFRLATSDTYERRVRALPPIATAARRRALRYVAGETLDDALAVARTLHARGLRAAIDFFGEQVRDAAGFAYETAGPGYLAYIPGGGLFVSAVADLIAGRKPDPKYGKIAKQRSLHNNYLTLPVLFAMISQHFPFTYGHENSWLVLLGFMALGALVRHVFNLRHQDRDIRRTVGLVVAGGVVLIVALAPQPQAAGLTAADFPAVQQVFQARCVTCHSSHPTNPGFTVAPKGVMFDTQAEIVANASRAYEQVVVTKAMPLGNVTGITDAERDLIGRWVRSGAPAP